MSRQPKIFLVDDHPLVREWLATLIKQDGRFEVCGGTGSAADARQLISQTAADIVFVDISLENGSGIELIKDIKAVSPQVRIIVLSMHDEMIYGERVMRAGADAYIMKREATEKVLEAIQCVLEGKKYFSHAVNAMLAQKLVLGSRGKTESPVSDLSDRELEVFELLGKGCNTRQISETLKLSFKTVQIYCARIKEKRNLANINELIAQAVRWHESRHR